MLKSRNHELLVAAMLPVAALFLAAASAAHAENAQPPAADQEARLIAVLKSDAPQKDKADACRELARVGSRDAVVPLAALLADEKLSHMARYGLETIPDPSVDEAFRDALGKLKGPRLVGVIGSLGVRRDAKAVEPLARMLADSDADVAQAAARALGRIGNSAAVQALTGALAAAPAANQLALYEGLLRAAESLAAAGRIDEAAPIYDRLRAVPQAPHQVRAAALRGAILMRRKAADAGLPLLAAALRGEDFVLFDAAVRASQEMPGPEVTKAMAADLANFAADKQIVLIQALGQRADAEALPAIFAAAKSREKPVRLAAVRAMPQLAIAAAVPVLEGLVADADREIAQAARDGLAALAGPQADAAIASMLGQADAKTRITAIGLVGQRRVVSAIPTLLKLAEDPDADVRSAAMKALGDLGGAAELPSVLGLVLKAKSPADMQAAEAALTALCARLADPAGSADRLIPALALTKGEPKLAILRVLRSVGGPRALDAMRAAAKDGDAEVRDAALRQLCDWPAAEAMSDLSRLARNADDPKIKVLALRGYIRLIPKQDAPAAKKLADLKDAMTLAERAEEKRLVLAALGGLGTPDALALVMPHLAAPDLKEEACLAAVAVAQRIVASDPAKVAEAMEKVVAATTNEQVSMRAKDVLKQAQGNKNK